MIKSVTQLLLT